VVVRPIARIAGVGLAGLSLLAAGGARPEAAGGAPGLRATIATSAAGPSGKVVRTGHTVTPPTTAQCRASFGIACYSPHQLQAAYRLTKLYGKGLSGRGRTIALVDSYGSPTIAADLSAFDKAFGLPAPPKLTTIAPAGPVPAFNSRNKEMVGWAQETSLDVEYAHAMAPGASILLVETPVAETVGVRGFAQIARAENYVIDHRRADVISQSFGTSEVSFPSRAALVALRSPYVNARKHHVTVLASSGDSGATEPSNSAGTTFYTTRNVGWPASDPLVTAVGGLQLHLGPDGGQVSPPTVWNDTARLGGPAAGGGGSSVVFARPAFQNAVKGVAGAARAVPDISLSAAVNGGALVYMSFPGAGGAGFYVIGGTSEATPLFAGVVAVADQAAGRDLGDLNPTLYRFARERNHGIVDVTAGNNTVTFTQGGLSHTVVGFSAGPGYDRASGLGTINAAKLVPALASDARA
jgi:subtilase family serine protease